VLAIEAKGSAGLCAT